MYQNLGFQASYLFGISDDLYVPKFFEVGFDFFSRKHTLNDVHKHQLCYQDVVEVMYIIN